MKSEQTSAVEWLFQQLWNEPKDKLTWHSILEKAKEIEKNRMIEFHKWMIENDTAQNAEKYFHYTDSDMLHEYYNETFKPE